MIGWHPIMRMLSQNLLSLPHFCTQCFLSSFSFSLGTSRMSWLHIKFMDFYILPLSSETDASLWLLEVTILWEDAWKFSDFKLKMFHWDKPQTGSCCVNIAHLPWASNIQRQAVFWFCKTATTYFKDLFSSIVLCFSFGDQLFKCLLLASFPL